MFGEVKQVTHRSEPHSVTHYYLLRHMLLQKQTGEAFQRLLASAISIKAFQRNFTTCHVSRALYLHM